MQDHITLHFLGQEVDDDFDYQQHFTNITPILPRKLEVFDIMHEGTKLGTFKCTKILGKRFVSSYESCSQIIFIEVHRMTAQELKKIGR